jgi:tetratricopeptide (TPR) repeat protein
MTLRYDSTPKSWTHLARTNLPVRQEWLTCREASGSEMIDTSLTLWQTASAACQASPTLPAGGKVLLMFRVTRLSLLLALPALSACAQSTLDHTPGRPVVPPLYAAPSSTQSPGMPPDSSNLKPDGSVPIPNSLGEAMALYRKGSFAAAIQKYQQVLQERPASPDAYAGLTRIYLKQGNLNLALDTANKGLALSDSARLHVAMAEVFFRQGKIPEAEQRWVNVINSGASEARAYLGLARVRNALSLYKKGKTMIDKAHELDPADPDIENYWIETLRLSERIQYLENYLARPDVDSSEDRADTLCYLAYLKMRTGEPQKRCRMVSHVTSTETPLVRLLLDPTHLRGYGLTVNLNGHNTRLLLDTGASGILVDRGAAEKAGITRLMETKIGGIGDKGSKNGHIGTAGSIKIGDLEFQDCPVEILENRSVVGEEGLIGSDVFSDFLVNIDFQKEKLRLSELPKRPDDEAAPSAPVSLHGEDEDADAPEGADSTAAPSNVKTTVSSTSRFHDPYIAPEMKSYTRVYRFGHDLLIPTKVGNAPIKLFLLDTGALQNQITPAAAREVTKVRGDPDMIVKGISGSVKNVYSADKAVLQFGRLRQENQDLMAFDLTSISQSAGTEVSGILGFALLHLLDLKIDYRDGLVDFEYKH